MQHQPVSSRAAAIMNAGTYRLAIEFINDVYLPGLQEHSGISDFTFGNPHEPVMAGVVDAFQTWIIPRDVNWFAYKWSEPEARRVVADSLREYLGIPFEPDDIAMTTGGFGALVSALKAVADPGDEVIYSLPPWFVNEPICVDAGLQPVKIMVNPETFDLDLDAIAAAITPRTRILIVNTPCNPTGRIIPPETLTQLAELLETASQRIGRRIYLLSDEAYNRIVFDNRQFRSPVEFYPYSFLAYSYGKTLMIPGQRLGYLAMPPTMPEEDRQQLYEAIEAVQAASGYLFPNALLKHAIGDLERLSHDMDHLTRKRDHMVDALREMGYRVHRPEGTFYLFPKSPIPDDREFANLLFEEQVGVLPGAVFETPGFFRICLTANDEMIERALPGFARAIQRTAVVAAD